MDTHKNMMTKYEKAHIIGMRAEQISQGSKSTIEVDPNITDPVQIAKLELDARKCPIIINRTFPDGSSKKVSVNDLIH